MATKHSRRSFLRAALVAGGALCSVSVLAACGGAAPAASTAAPASQPASSTVIPASQAAPAPTSAPVAAGSTPAAASQAAPGPTTEAGAPGPELVVKPAQKAQVTLRFHMRTGGEKSEPAIYQYRPDEWAQQTGMQYKLEPIAADQYFPKVEALAASNTIGDVLWTSDVASQHSHLVKFNVLEPVDSYMGTNKILKDEWFKSITDTLTYNGKMYGLPKTGHPGDAYIWINLKMFKDAGIPEPPTYGVSFDDVRTWANKLSKGPKENRDVYGYYSGVVGLQPITNGVRQFGGDLVNADGTASTVDGEGFKGWLDWNYQLLVQDKVHPFSQAIPNGDLAAVFAAEKVAMIHSQRYFQFAAVNAVKDKFPFTSIQFPRGPKAKGWGASIDTHSVSAASKYKDEAFSLIYALADKRFAFLVGKFQGYLTGRLDNLQDLGPYGQDHFIQLQQKCTEQAEQFWRAKNLRGAEVETTINNQLDLIWLGKSQPGPDYIRSLKQALDDVLAKPV